MSGSIANGQCASSFSGAWLRRLVDWLERITHAHIHMVRWSGMYAAGTWHTRRHYMAALPDTILRRLFERAFPRPDGPFYSAMPPDMIASIYMSLMHVQCRARPYCGYDQEIAHPRSLQPSSDHPNFSKAFCTAQTSVRSSGPSVFISQRILSSRSSVVR